jgi:uncharacterized protein (DUF1684 family)
MRRLVLCFSACALSLVLGAAAPSPEAAWQAGIADENKDYAQVPHAMLKIQDSAYIGEGQAAILTGRKGDPASWRWAHDAKAAGVLRATIRGGKLAIDKDGKAIDPALATKSIAIDKDVDVAGQPTQVGAGINGWRLFVYNQKNPDAVNFKGVSYYPYDPAFRVEARFVPDAKLPARVFRTSRGTTKQFYHAGDAHFTLGGHEIALPFFADNNAPAGISVMSAFYTDGLTGKGAYPAGRYVDIDHFGAFPPATVTIDFNQAYNPNCARSAHFTCPLATDSLPLAMAAGERDPHSH